MISYKSFLAERGRCVPVSVHAHVCRRRARSRRGQERAVTQSAWLLSATTVHRQKRKGHYTEIAYRPRVSVQEGLQAQPAAGVCRDPRLQRSCQEYLSVGAERD